jgi:hypothetical protein
MERNFEDFDMYGLRYNLAIETQNGLETIQSKSEFRPVVVLSRPAKKLSVSRFFYGYHDLRFFPSIK